MDQLRGIPRVMGITSNAEKNYGMRLVNNGREFMGNNREAIAVYG